MPLTRRTVLILMVAGLVPAFAITGTFARYNRRYLVAEAAQWRAQGARDLTRREPAAAVDAFRVALARGGDDPAVRLQLAQALIAAGQPTEAGAHLRTLWTEAPGDGTVNLALARLAMQSGDTRAATRYYHAAIDGAWDRDPAQARRDVRFELARMLLQHHDPTGARAELILLADVVRDDAAQTLAVARMLVDAGDSRTALTLARRIVAASPADVDALILAGELEFRSANYAGAAALLQRAERRRALPVDAASALRDAQDVLALDPLAPRIGAAARQMRLRRMLTAAQQRVDACVTTAQGQPSPDLQALAQRLRAATHVAAAGHRADADDLDEALAVVTAVEQLPDTDCGPSSPDDRTLRLIVAAHPAT